MTHSAARVSEGRILLELRTVEASVLREDNSGALYVLPSVSTREQRLYNVVGKKLQRQTATLQDPLIGG